MDINRNNYEEYFLLYADNELTDSEKTEVLMFIKQNKDLEEEFRMIHHTICKPDINVELADKSLLLRGGEASFINEKNYEEIFVLYHDNELTDIQKKGTEDFLLRHAPLKNEFELIGMAKLTPENSVVFPNKRRLYKKERTEKVVPVIFWRALAAAVFIGSGLWITQLYILKESKKPPVAVRVPVKQSTPAIKKSVLPANKTTNALVQSPGKNSRGEIIQGKEKLQKPVSQEKTNNTLVKAPVKTQKTARENLIGQSQEVSNEEKIDEVAIVHEKIENIPVEQITGDTKIEPSKKLPQNTIRADVDVQPVMYAQSASYIQDANDNSQNYVFYDITTEEFKKTKVSGFLKKVKRVIERNNPISRLLSGNEKQVVSN